MDVVVMSRRRAEMYCDLKHDVESVIISISSPNMKYKNAPYMSEQNNVKDILSLSMYDADGEGYDVYGTRVVASDLMRDEQAQEIADFVRKYEDKRIIVHCDAGISRSAGVAAAILRSYTGDDSQIFDHPHHAPNMYIYYKVLKAFGYDYTPDGYIEGIQEDGHERYV